MGKCEGSGGWGRPYEGAHPKAYRKQACLGTRGWGWGPPPRAPSPPPTHTRRLTRAGEHVDAVVGVLGRVAVHDVHQHHHAQAVRLVDHRLELVGGAAARGGREEVGDVVAEAPVVAACVCGGGGSGGGSRRRPGEGDGSRPRSGVDSDPKPCLCSRVLLDGHDLDRVVAGLADAGEHLVLELKVGVDLVGACVCVRVCVCV